MTMAHPSVNEFSVLPSEAVEDGLAVIAQGHGPGAFEGSEVSELFTTAANGRRSSPLKGCATVILQRALRT